MSCGCVPLLPSEGGVDVYARDQENALVVDTSNKNAILTAAREFLSNPELRARLREEGLRTAENFSVKAAVDSIAQLYQKALEERKQA